VSYVTCASNYHSACCINLRILTDRNFR